MTVPCLNSSISYAGGAAGGAIIGKQTFSISVSGGNTFTNTAVSAVVLANTIMQVRETEFIGTALEFMKANFELTSTTNIRAERKTSTGATSSVYSVILYEYEAGSFASNQFISSTATSATTATAAISSVDINKSYGFSHSMFGTGAGGNGKVAQGSLDATAATTATWTYKFDSTLSTPEHRGQIVEFP